MKKQGRHFIILIAVLTVLVVGYFCLRQYNTHQQEKEAEQVDGEVLVDIDQEDILRFSYVYEDETYSFERSGEDGEWVSADDPSLNLTQSRLDNMAGKFASVTAKDTITGVTDLSQYGLEEPSNVLHWETAENSYTYYVGEYNSFGSVYYFCEPDSDTIYTVSSALVYGFNYSLEDLIEAEEESGEPEEAEAPEESGTEDPEESEATAE